jgi:hypothetical protein
MQEIDVIMKRVLLTVPVVTLLAACGGSESNKAPTAPTTETQTRQIRLEANLDFGDVAVGGSSERVLRIYNNGNAPMTVTGLTGPAGYTASWTSGTIQPGSSEASTIRFAPTEERSYSGTLTVNANHTSGTNTMAISAKGVFNGPRTQFGQGTHLVNTDIAAGRYFGVPSDGCYWERLSGLGGTLNDVIANEFIGFSAGQWIVDIKGSDRAFKTDPDCGTWFNSPRAGTQNTVKPGVWLVGNQVAPGTYRTNASDGCYWERRRHFEGNLNGIIANDFVSGGGSVIVSIAAGDAGFQADDACGEWTRVQSAISETPIRSGAQSASEIEHNWRMRRQRNRLQ